MTPSVSKHSNAPVADPVTLAIAAGALGVAAIVAAFAPASKAARVDPLIALRCE